MGISLEKWNMFERRWNVFKSGLNINDSVAAPHLFQCSDGDLGDALLKVDANITTQPLNLFLATIKALDAIPMATGVLRAELLDMKQKRDKPYRSFSSRVCGKAETCAFLTVSRCVCGLSNSVDYTDQIIRDVLISGIYDTDICRDILGIDGITDRPVNDVISLVEKREMTRDANSVSASMFSFSSYKKFPDQQKTPRSPSVFSEPCTTNRINERVPCPQCGNQFAPFKEGRSKPHSEFSDSFQCY